MVKNNYDETKEARCLLEKMLSSLNIEMKEIQVSDSGKPYYKDSDIYFNYSHSDSYIVCAVSKTEVGIDIEDANTLVSDDIAKRYLDGIDDDLRLDIWVKKESYSKLKGLGLGIELQTINLEDINNSNLLLKNPKYICSIYSEEDSEFVKMR